MKTPDSTETMFFNRPEGLARMLALDDTASDLWSPGEMQGIWRHQLSAPIGLDLGLETGSGAGSDAAGPKGFAAKTFAQVLAEPHPSLALLKMVKGFAKETSSSSEDAQLKSVGVALYYAAYAAGLVRCQQRLGSAKDAELQRGFDWALSLDWLDESSRKLVGEAAESLGGQRVS
jgi:hypothetical protein